MSSDVETLRSWSHFLFWLSVVLPILGAAAGVARFYVDRQERRITSPRSFDAAQRAGLIRALTNDPGHRVVVASLMVDPESANYGELLTEVLKEGKWDVTHVKTSLNDFKGVSVSSVRAQGQPVPGYLTLTSALEAAGVKVQSISPRTNSIGTGLTEGTILLLVGRE